MSGAFVVENKSNQITMKKVIALAIIIIALASCSTKKLTHSHYTKGVTHGQDGCAWHR